MAEINKIQFKRGATLSNAGTPDAGEPIYDTTTKKLYIGDGSTAAAGATPSLVAISDDKLPLTGGTLTGDLNVTADGARLFVNSADYELVSIGRAGSSTSGTPPPIDQGYLRMKSAGTNKIALHTGGDSYIAGGGLSVNTTSLLESTYTQFEVKQSSDATGIALTSGNTNAAARNWGLFTNYSAWGSLDFRYSSGTDNTPRTNLALALTKDGDATFSGAITQNAGTFTIKNASSDSNGLRIFQDSSDASKIYNHYNGTLQLGVGNTTAITIDSSEKSTLAGELRVDGGQASIYGLSGGGDAILELNANAANDNDDRWQVYIDASANSMFKVRNYASGSWVDKLRMDNAHLYIDGVGHIQASRSSDPGLKLISSESNTDDWHMYIAGSGLKFRNTTDSNTAFELTHANNAVFSGSITGATNSHISYSSGQATSTATGGALNVPGSDIVTGRLFLQGYQNNGGDLVGFNNEPTQLVIYNYTDGAYLTKITHGGNLISYGTVTVGNTYTLPSSMGSAGQVLKVPSSGSVLEWGAAGGSSNSISGDLTITDYEPQITLTKTRNTTESFRIAHNNDNGVLDFMRDSTRTARITENGRWVIGGHAEVDSSQLSVQGNLGVTGLAYFKYGSSSNDNVRFYNQDGSYSYIRVTANGNNANTWFDTRLGSTTWFGWTNTGGSGVSSWQFGTGGSTGANSVLISSGSILQYNSSGSNTTTLNADGSATFGGRINVTEIRGSSVAIKDSNADLMAYFQDGSSRLYSNGYNLRLESSNELNLYNGNSVATLYLNHSGNNSTVNISDTELIVTKGTGSTFFGKLRRSGHSVGHFEGSYNNVGANSQYSNPIYTIGSNYNPSDSSLSDMYGIGFSHGNFWGSSDLRPTGWGMYAASGGTIRCILDGQNGIIWASSAFRTSRGQIIGVDNSHHELRSNNNAAVGLRLSANGNLRGWLYSNDYYETGFLDTTGNWDLRKTENSHLQLYGSGSNVTKIGSGDEWGRLEFTNHSNGTYIYANQGSFKVDNAHWTTYDDAELDLGGGQTSNRWRNLYLQAQIIGGFGAMGTGGVTNWNDSSNARSGAGYTLLLGNASNGPSGTGDYFHSHSYEYGSSGGNGNLCQFAIPYIVGSGGGMYMRSRYSGGWGGWVKFHDSNNLYGIARTSNTYGSFNVTNGLNSWAGITYSSHSSKPTIMFKDNHGDGGLYHQGSSSWRWYYDQNNGCIGLNGSTTNSSYGAYVTGSVYTTGSYGSSDVRFKENIETIDNGLDKVMKMRGVYFDWNDEHKEEKGDSRQVGVIAQEIRTVLPEVVMHQDNDEFAVDYSKITAVLIEAIKDLKNEINELKKGCCNGS